MTAGSLDLAFRFARMHELAAAMIVEEPAFLQTLAPAEAAAWQAHVDSSAVAIRELAIALKGDSDCACAVCTRAAVGALRRVIAKGHAAAAPAPVAAWPPRKSGEPDLYASKMPPALAERLLGPRRSR